MSEDLEGGEPTEPLTGQKSLKRVRANILKESKLILLNLCIFALFIEMEPITKIYQVLRVHNRDSSYICLFDVFL